MAKKHPRPRRSQPALQVKIEGPTVRPGRIAIPDLLVICEHLQTAVNRQAEALTGRKRTLHPGPKPAAIQAECTLELVSISKGSAVLGVDQAKPQPHLPVPNLGDDAVAGVLDAIQSVAEGNADDVDVGVLTSLSTMGELFARRDLSSIKLILPAKRSIRRRRVVDFTPAVQQRIRARLKPPTVASMTLDGTLEMADFKPSEQRCRIHPTLGPSIACTFDADREEDVYRLLRQVVKVRGNATINSQTGRTESIHLAEIAPLDPLAVDAGAFFKGFSFDQLAQMQAVEPVHDAADLAGGWPDDDDLDEFLSETYRQRA